ncbi:hypothetical protein HDE_00245 [Halotydeus destructor]|nr:hypothetical protein HDE_00245 [Halotydeus destructor]
MDSVVVVFWMITLIKSINCQAIDTTCPGQVGPDALFSSGDVAKVYKGRDVHYLIKQEHGRMPIINYTANILKELKLQKDYSIGAVITTSRLYYFCDVSVLNISVMCHGDTKHVDCESSTLYTDSIRVTHLSTASVFHRKVFVAFNDDKGIEYQAIVNASRNFLIIKKLDKMADGRKQNPTGLNFLWDKKSRYHCLVFFDTIYGVHDEELDTLKTPVVIRKTIDYQLSNTWLGCDPDLCFDGRVDFAYHDQGFIVMGRGHSRWRINLNNTTAPEVLMREKWIADDVIKSHNAKYIIDGKTTTVEVYNSNTLANTKRLFKDTPLPIEAAFALDTSKFYLIYGKEAAIFSRKNVYSFERDRLVPLRDVFNFFEDSIDAADSDGNRIIYVFSKNHYYTHDVETNITSPPMSMQKNLFTCHDSFYSSSKASAMLDITNFEEFEQYRLQFAPTSEQTTSRPVSATAVSNVSMGVTSVSSTGLFLSLVLLILSTMVFMTTFIIYLAYKMNVTPTSEDKAEVAAADFTLNPGSASVDLKPNTVQVLSE